MLLDKDRHTQHLIHYECVYLEGGGKFTLGLLGSLPDSLQGHVVLGQIHPGLRKSKILITMLFTMLRNMLFTMPRTMLFTMLHHH